MTRTLRRVARPVCVRIAGAALLLSSAAAGQTQVPYDYSDLWPPPGAAGRFAQNMVVRDIDHDGFNDIVATAAQSSAQGVSGSGKALVLFGPTLNRFIEISAAAPTASEMLGFSNNSLSIGDVNGDGEYDVLLGAAFHDGRDGALMNSGRAHLFLGPDFGTNIVFNNPEPEEGDFFGYALVLADLDGDGLDDVTVGAYRNAQRTDSGVLTWAGQAWLWRAPDWTAAPVEIIQPDPQAFGQFGLYMTAVPPLAGGPGLDLLVNASFYSGPLGNKGVSYRYDGVTLELIDLITAPSSWTGWTAYASLGDQQDADGDGIPDMIVHRFNAGAGGVGISAAIVTGPDYKSAMATFAEPPGFGTGFAEEGAFSDLNRDGNIDLVLSDATYTGFSGAVYIFRGPDFQGSAAIVVPATELSGIGTGLEVGDLDGDGFDEILVQAVAGGLGVLRVYHRRTLQADVDVLSLGAGGPVNLTLDLPDERAGHSYFAALSLSEPGEGLILGPGSYLPFQADEFTTVGLSLIGTPILQGFAGTLDALGNARLTLNWPAGVGASLVDETLHIAAITASPSGTPGPGTSEVRITLSH